MVRARAMLDDEVGTVVGPVAFENEVCHLRDKREEGDGIRVHGRQR